MLTYNLFSIGSNNEYWTELKSAANELGMDWRALDTYCYIENGRKLVDSNGDQYRGILQWGNDAAKSLGYSSSAQMIAQNNTYALQFQLVRKWINLLWRNHGKRTEAGYLYLCHFLPVNARHYADKNYILRGENGRLVKRGYNYYDQNAWLDYNNDGVMTVADIDNTVYAKAKEAGHDLGTTINYTSNLTEDNNSPIDQVEKVVNVFISLLPIGMIFVGIKVVANVINGIDKNTKVKRKYIRKNTQE